MSVQVWVTDEHMIYTNDNQSIHQDMWYSAKGVLRSEGMLLIVRLKKISLKINNLRIHKRMLSHNVIKDGQFHF